MYQQMRPPNSARMSYPTSADGVLIEQALMGDQRSFEALVEKYERSLRSYIGRIIKDHELIADVLQFVFLKFYVSLPKMQTNVPLKAWLYRVAYNRCLDELRMKSRRPAICFSQLEGEDREEILAETLMDPQLTPEEIIEQQDHHAQLIQALGELAPITRSVVRLRCFGELSFPEIGKRLNIPASTAKTHFYRSLPRLRATFL